MMDKKIIFRRKISGSNPASLIVCLPKEILNALNIVKGDYLNCYIDEGKYGRYIAFWPEKQREEQKQEHELTVEEIQQDTE